MLKRILIYFQGNKDIEVLLKYGKFLEEIYGAEIAGTYLKKISISAAIDGGLAESKVASETLEWKNNEEKISESIKESFKKEFEGREFYTESGDINTLLDRLKYFDVLIVGKNEKVEGNLINILKSHNKPLLLVPNIENLNLKFNLEKVVFADDNEINSNKSFFRFMNIFEKVENYTILTVNKEFDSELKKYTDKIEKHFYYITREGEVIDEILKESEKHDLLIMGNLKHSLTYEKITKKPGIGLLQKSKKIIFIG